MPLAELVVEDLRCIERLETALHPGLNLVSGPNGAGKTSILEALFLLGRGRSFRTRSSERLIRHDQDRLISFGRTASHAIGVEVRRDPGRSGATTRAKVNGEFVGSLAELTTIFPVQVIDPEIQQLVDGGATGRRRWLDWSVFHVEPGFGDCWARYARALKQRNAALRGGASPGALVAWDRELVAAGVPMAEARARHFDDLEARWREAQQALLGTEVSATWTWGWDRERTLEVALQGARDHDVSRGTTSVGPHRADLRLRVGHRAAREVLSRGQQKLLALSMVFAQLELLQSTLQIRPTLLIDDPAAELDNFRLSVVVERVRALETQLVVTTLAPETSLFGRPDRVLQIGQGRVQSL
ncbi:MAG TPA: DNA replication/repair protein RecF [Steroidobacteraceae bacterium]|nr:DNA replication/repair protein RecF [Steroidobacteraceae bacterium]